jgi:hypothetical protein
MKFLAAVAALAAAALSAPLSPPNRPVNRVIRLLREMAETVAKERTEDAAWHDKMECWCKTNGRVKDAAIEEAERRINSLSAEIEEGIANAARYTTEIKNLKDEIAQHESSLTQATAIREKERAEFSAEEESMLETLDALKQAIEILSKHHPDSLLQVSAVRKSLAAKPVVLAGKFAARMQKDLWDVLGAAELPREHHLTTADILSDVFSDGGKAAEAVLAQDEPTGAVAGVKSYNSRSGQIFGVLKQMQDEFNANLSESQKKEKMARERFAQLKKSLNDSIAVASQSLRQTESALAETEQRTAQAKEERKDTMDALTADQQFVVEMRQKCTTSAAEFDSRQKERSEEIVAISDALKILTSDDSRDLFTRTFTATSFVEVDGTATGRSAAAERALRERAATKLLKAARKSKTLELANLAVTVRLDGFKKVKEAMDLMIAQLKVQQTDEVKHRDFCIAELDKNEDSAKAAGLTKDDLESRISEDAVTIRDADAALEELKKQISELQVGIKRAGEDRATENKTFQETVQDQRATQQILKKVIARLEKFYNKSLVQEDPANVVGKQVMDGPGSAKEYKKSGGAMGVLAILQNVVKDAQSLESQAMKDEQNAQSSYAAMIQDMNASVRSKSQAVVDRTMVRAAAEQDKIQAETELSATQAELEKLADGNAALHLSCDFVMKNFDVRQESRQQEMDAIAEAKAVLSGMQSL